jgi:hypothetical protein
VNFKIALLGITNVSRIGRPVREAFGQEDMLLLVEDAVAYLQRSEAGHAGGDEASLFAELTAGHLFRVGMGILPAALGEFDMACSNGVAILRDEGEELAFRDGFKRDDDAGRVFVDDAVDAPLAIGALDDVFADAGPGIAIDFAAADGLDRGLAQAFFSVFQ